MLGVSTTTGIHGKYEKIQLGLKWFNLIKCSYVLYFSLVQALFAYTTEYQCLKHVIGRVT